MADVFEVLSYPMRRHLVRVLEGHERMHLDDIVDEFHTHDDDLDGVRTMLHHLHLPKLAEAGVIRYHPDTHIVEVVSVSGIAE